MLKKIYLGNTLVYGNGPLPAVLRQTTGRAMEALAQYDVVTGEIYYWRDDDTLSTDDLSNTFVPGNPVGTVVAEVVEWDDDIYVYAYEEPSGDEERANWYLYLWRLENGSWVQKGSLTANTAAAEALGASGRPGWFSEDGKLYPYFVVQPYINGICLTARWPIWGNSGWGSIYEKSGELCVMTQTWTANGMSGRQDQHLYSHSGSDTGARFETATIRYTENPTLLANLYTFGVYGMFATGQEFYTFNGSTWSWAATTTIDHFIGWTPQEIVHDGVCYIHKPYGYWNVSGQTTNGQIYTFSNYTRTLYSDYGSNYTSYYNKRLLSTSDGLYMWVESTDASTEDLYIYKVVPSQTSVQYTLKATIPNGNRISNAWEENGTLSVAKSTTYDPVGSIAPYLTTSLDGTDQWRPLGLPTAVDGVPVYYRLHQCGTTPFLVAGPSSYRIEQYKSYVYVPGYYLIQTGNYWPGNLVHRSPTLKVNSIRGDLLSELQVSKAPLIGGVQFTAYVDADVAQNATATLQVLREETP